MEYVERYRFISDREIEAVAMSQLRDYEIEYGAVKAPPIPVEKIIEHKLNLQIDWDEIEESNGEKIFGLINPATRKISMNTKHKGHFNTHVGTEAFTYAHEIGHWDLHVNLNAGNQLSLFEIESKTVLCRQLEGDRMEYQAERYASFLLMPKQLVLDSIKGIDLTRFSNLYSLKDEFGVTITAFTKRLRDLVGLYIRDDKKIFLSRDEAFGTKRLV